MDRHKEALQANYKIGNYGIKFCSNCLQPIENYSDIKTGLCRECQEIYN